MAGSCFYYSPWAAPFADIFRPFRACVILAGFRWVAPIADILSPFRACVTLANVRWAAPIADILSPFRAFLFLMMLDGLHPTLTSCIYITSHFLQQNRLYLRTEFFVFTGLHTIYGKCTNGVTHKAQCRKTNCGSHAPYLSVLALC